MDDATYRAEVLAAYEGEIGGEISAAVLMRHLAADGTRAVKLDLMRRLEARVAAVLEFGPRLDPYVARFEALHAAARPGDEAALALLVAHEQALIDFGRLETAGDDAGALACLRAAVGVDH